MKNTTFLKFSKINRITSKLVYHSWGICFLFLFFSCDIDEDDFEAEIEKVNIIIDQTRYDTFTDIRSQRPDFEVNPDAFIIQEAIIEDVLLQIIVSYSGGCETHTFDIFWPESVTQIYPPKITVYLTHDANQDPCEAAITEVINIDLTENNLNYTRQIIDELEIIVVNGYDRANQVSTAD